VRRERSAVYVRSGSLLFLLANKTRYINSLCSLKNYHLIGVYGSYSAHTETLNQPGIFCAIGWLFIRLVRGLNRA